MTERSATRERDTKRFSYSVERICVCGHRLGQHTAARTKEQHPCLEAECACEKFKPHAAGRLRGSR